MNRRGFLSALPAVPFIRPPNIECHVLELIPEGEFVLLRLAAPREMDAPTLETEEWDYETTECEVCGGAGMRVFKRRVTVVTGSGRMLVPPVVEKPQEIFVLARTDCKVWVDGVEIDWMSFDDAGLALNGTTRHKYGFLP